MRKALKFKENVVPWKFLDQKPLAKLSCSLSPASKRRKLQNIENLVRLQPRDDTSTPSPSNWNDQQDMENIIPLSSTKQDNLTKHQSCTIGIQVTPVTKHKTVQTAYNLIQYSNQHTQTTFKKKNTQSVSPGASATSVLSSSPSEYGITTSSDEIEPQEELEKLMKQQRIKTTIHLIDKQPLFYIGLPPSITNLIDIIVEKMKMSREHIYVTLQKVRLNHSYQSLGNDFGCSVSHIHRIFIESLHKLASFFQNAIFWPTPDDIRKTLPLQFRPSFAKVQSIIDCFEIEIEKPKRAFNQAATWSEYKHCNTIKYLISCTPNGLINFISKGYGGRISDKDIVVKSGYLDILPQGAQVLADRGFKHISHLLEERQCSLVRPPSVPANVKSSHEKVIEGRRIAAVRVHVERVIKRIREFTMLRMHTVIHHKLIPYLNLILIIVCGIVNIQNPIIST